MHYFILAFVVMVGKCAKIGGTQGFSAQLLDIVGHRDLGTLVKNDYIWTLRLVGMGVAWGAWVGYG